MHDKTRVEKLLELSDQISMLARRFHYLAGTVAEHDAPEAWTTMVEAVGRQLSEQLQPVATVVELVDRMSRRPVIQNVILCKPSQVAYLRRVLD